jgi:hypothetical protein
MVWKAFGSHVRAFVKYLRKINESLIKNHPTTLVIVVAVSTQKSLEISNKGIFDS